VVDLLIKNCFKFYLFHKFIFLILKKYPVLKKYKIKEFTTESKNERRIL